MLFDNINDDPAIMLYVCIVYMTYRKLDTSILGDAHDKKVEFNYLEAN